jgi:hypothetical protein
LVQVATRHGDGREDRVSQKHIVECTTTIQRFACYICQTLIL